MHGIIKLWDVATGSELLTLPGDEVGVDSVAFSPDGRTLASSGYKEIELWDVATGRELKTLAGHTEGVKFVAFSPDGLSLASGGSDRTIKLWDVATGRELRTLRVHTSVATSVAFSPDGRTLASGSGEGDKTIKLWDVATGRELRTLPGHRDWIVSVAFSPNGRTLASGSYRTIILWDVATGRELRTLVGHNGWANSVAFNPDGLSLASGGEDRTIKLWKVATGRELRTLGGYASLARPVSFSPDGNILATGETGDSNDTIKLWDVATGRELRTLEKGTRASSVVFSPDGGTLTCVSPSDVKTIKLWDVATGRELKTLPGHTEAKGVESVAFSPDGRTLASGGSDYTIKLWEVASGRELRTLKGHTIRGYYYDIESVAFSPDGRTLASGSSDGTVSLWEVASGRELRTLGEPHYGEVWFVAFSPDGLTLASGGADFNYAVKLWDVATGRELRALGEPYKHVTFVAFSPDGRTLASGRSDNTLKLWDAVTGRDLRTLAGDGFGGHIAFSPDWLRIAAVRGNGTVGLWDFHTGAEVLSLISFADGEWVSITPEGYYKSSAKGDQYLNVRVGNRVYGIDQWRRTFDQPKIVEAALRTGDTRQAIASVLGNVPATDLIAGTIPEPPSIEVRSPASGSTLSTASAEVAFVVEDAQRPIESVSIVVNGRKVVGSGDREVRPQAPGTALTKLVIPSGRRRLDLAVPVRLDPGSNRIEVSAFNGIAEARKVVEVSFSAPPSIAASILPNLWLLAIGVNHYESPQFTSLGYAVEDATAVAEAFAKQQGKVFGEVHTLLITDKSQLKPTFANITDNLNYLKKAGQFDVVLFFVAGHGLVDSSGDFYFLPNNAALDDEGGLRRSLAVSWRELKSVLDVPAKKIILLDACHSEGVTGRKTRDVESDMLVRELQDTRGLIISSSRGKELSQESAQWKHGAFTYALLEGLGGKAPSSNGKITLLDLAAYVSRRVPELTNGAQHPITDTAGGYELFELVQSH